MATIPQHTSNSIHRTMKMEASSKHYRKLKQAEITSRIKSKLGLTFTWLLEMAKMNLNKDGE